MTGYVRKDTTNNIADGNVINAADLDAEFDGVQDAFNASTGHKHDGTAGEGATINALGPTQDVTISAVLVAPKTTNTVDIGSNSLKFKDLFLAGNGSVGGTLAVTGVATFTAQPILSSLTASRAVFSDGSKGLVSNAITGTGNVVMSASPTLTGTIDAAALTASGNVTLSGGTANGVAYLNGSKVVTSGSALTFDGTTLNNSGAFGTSTAALTLKNSSAANSSNIVEQQFFASNSFSGLDTIAKFGALNPSAGGNNYGTFYWSLANAGSPSEQMRLTSTGLGIGTSSPTRKLSVFGSGNFTDGTNDITLWNDGSVGTNGNINLKFNTNGGLKATLDTSGNLGLGVTPSAWDASGAGGPVLQIKRGLLFGADTEIRLLQNAFYGTGDFRYIASGVASTNYQQNSGQHRWYNAPSGTAGNAITFTQAMTLDASGNLGVGSTSPSARLELAGVSSPQIALNGSANTGYRGISYQYNGTQYGFTGLNVQNGEFLIRSGESGQSGYYLSFATNGTERARIDSSGNLLVGTTSAPAKLSIAYTTTAVFGIDIKPSADSGAYAIYFRNAANSGVGSITTSASATSYNTSSDYRLKNTIAPMTGALAKVALLKPVTYKWNVDGSDGEGFIAHELAEVVPQCVTGEKDAVDENGNPKYQGIDTSFLVATLTAALQEAVAEMNQLKARLDAANL